MMRAMNGITGNVLSILLVIVVVMLPLQSPVYNLAVSDGHGQGTEEAELTPVKQSRHDCRGCGTRDCCGPEGCHLGSHCVSLTAMPASRILLPPQYLVPHKVHSSDIFQTFRLIHTIYRPPWA
jgi:hypothetical protein